MSEKESNELITDSDNKTILKVVQYLMGGDVDHPFIPDVLIVLRVEGKRGEDGKLHIKTNGAREISLVD